MIDELPIFVSLNQEVTQCQCCGKEHLKRTLCLSSSEMNPIYLGVICAGRWFEVNLSGNPHKAAARLKYVISKQDNQYTLDIIDQIKEAAQEWE